MALVVCFLLAVTLAAAGFAKLRDPQPFRRTVGSVLPASATELVVRTLPSGELVLAAVLISGVASRFVGALVAVLFLAFIAALRAVERRVAARDLPQARCHCFGESGDGDPRTAQVRNALLAVGAATLLAWPAEPIWRAGVSDVLGAASVVVGVVCLWTLTVVLVRDRRVGLA